MAGALLVAGLDKPFVFSVALQAQSKKLANSERSDTIQSDVGDCAFRSSSRL
jgi:hypothetical protein